MTYLRHTALVTAVTLALPLALVAQAPGTGGIHGTVDDVARSPLVKAQIQITNDSTGAIRVLETTQDGFTSSLLAPGLYSVVVADEGFEKQELQHVAVVAGETAALTFTLRIAEHRETVQVTAQSGIAQTQSATLGRSVDSQAAEELPLANRNFTQLLSLSPGIVVSLPDATALGRNTQNVTADGNKTTANNIQFNGVDANNLAQNSAQSDGEEVGVAVPAPDTIQEFKVQTANYDASYGRGTGANVDLISKSGTNSFHGDAREFLRNDVLNANTFFRKANGQPRPILKQNQFGVAAGGPVFKDKTFFFAAYQGLRSSNGLATAPNVTLPQLTSDRSAPTLGAEFCSSGPTFAGGAQLACDGSNVNPVALKLLNFKFSNGQYAIPSPQTLLPTVPGQTPVGTSSFSIPASYREDQFTADIDHALTAMDAVWARFFYSHAPTSEPFSPNAATVPGWGTNELDQNTMLVLGHSHVFNSNLINLARFGYTRFDGNSTVANPIGASDIGTVGPMGTADAGVPIPDIIFDQLSNFSLGDGGTPFQRQLTNSFIWQDTVSMTRGRQSIRAGGEAKHHQVMIDPPYSTSGFMEFSTFNDFLLGQSATQNGSPEGRSNIEAVTGSSGIFRKDERYNDFAAFVQDDIRLTSRASLFAGLRYEIFGAPSEAHGRLATFDPAIASLDVPETGTFSGFVVPKNFNGTVPKGVLQTDHDGFWTNNFFDFSPRVGFSVQVSDSPVVLLRGGYGIYFDRLSAGLVENLVNQAPFAQTQSLSFAQAGGATEQSPYTPLLPPTSSYPEFSPRVPGGTQTLYGVDPRVKDPYTQEYNLNVQAAFARDYLFEAGYVGSRSVHIPGGVEFNQALLASPENPINGGITNTGANITSRLPYEGVSTGSIIYQTRFPSNYNSLQTSLTKRVSHGLQFLASYTYSKVMDETSGTGGGVSFEEWLLSNDQNKPSQAYGPTDFDRTHRGVLSVVYEVPSLTNRGRAVRAVLGGWETSAIAVAQSGSPLTILDGFAGAVYGNFENRAQSPISNPMTSGSLSHRAQNSYLNASAFPSAPEAPNGESPQDTDFGNSSTGFLRGPGQRNIDFAVERSIPIERAVNFRFRTEFFNLTNTPNFSNPNVNLSSGPAFGSIRGSGNGTANNPRVIQLAAKLVF